MLIHTWQDMYRLLLIRVREKKLYYGMTEYCHLPFCILDQSIVTPMLSLLELHSRRTQVTW